MKAYNYIDSINIRNDSFSFRATLIFAFTFGCRCQIVYLKDKIHCAAYGTEGHFSLGVLLFFIIFTIFFSVMQNYNDIPQLAGLEEDLALKQEMEAKIVCCKALKCYYIALTYLNGQKWPEARALFQRATIYANKAKNDTIVPDSMREGKQLKSI